MKCNECCQKRKNDFSEKDICKPTIQIDMVYDTIYNPDNEIRLMTENLSFYIKEFKGIGKLVVIAKHISSNTYDIKLYDWLGTFKISFDFDN